MATKTKRMTMNNQPWIKHGVTQELWQNLKSANPDSTDKEISRLAKDVKKWWKTFKKHYIIKKRVAENNDLFQSNKERNYRTGCIKN